MMRLIYKIRSLMSFIFKSDTKLSEKEEPVVEELKHTSNRKIRWSGDENYIATYISVYGFEDVEGGIENIAKILNRSKKAILSKVWRITNGMGKNDAKRVLHMESMDNYRNTIKYIYTLNKLK